MIFLRSGSSGAEMVVGFQSVPVVVGVQSGMLKPLGTNQAMNRRGGVQAAAPARRDHRADGKKGKATVTAALPRNSRRECRALMSSPIASRSRAASRSLPSAGDECRAGGDGAHQIGPGA